jgi:hypothetical protein
MIAGLFLAWVTLCQVAEAPILSPASAVTSVAANTQPVRWATFVLDHPRWRNKREVGISRTGLVLTLEWLSPVRARLTSMRLTPDEVSALFDLIERRVPFFSLKSDCPSTRQPRYLLSGEASVPAGGNAVCEDVETQLAPLLSALEQLLARASTIWTKHSPGEHPPGAIVESKEPLNLLTDILRILHANESSR